MKFTTSILALTITLISFYVGASDSYQHNHAITLLDAENAAYVVIGGDKDLKIITYAYKDAAETCKFLIGSGVLVKQVKNYNIRTETNELLTTQSNC